MVRHTQRGFTLIEFMVAVAMVGGLVAMAFPQMNQWIVNQRAKSAARSMANAFSLARSEAIKTGNNHIVFFQADAQGNALVDAAGNQVPILILDDGPPGSPLQNCLIDAGETARAVPAEFGVNWGVTNAAVAVPTDFGTGGPIATGSSFADTGGNPATWLLFQPQGVPVGFSPACAIGGVGSGAGAGYLTNGNRDYAVVVTPLGGVRVHAWARTTGQWTN